MTHHKSLGISGSRDGLTLHQRAFMLSWMRNHNAQVVHHGDCIGADEQVARLFSTTFSYIIAHPGHIAAMRANCEVNDLTLSPLNTLVRNRFIVKHSNHILAFPSQRSPGTRSGTWYTIDYAQKQNKPVTVVLPSGEVQEFPRNENRDRPLRLVQEQKD